MREEKTRKIVFITNPISGTQNKKAIMDLVEKSIDKEKFSYEIQYTQWPGHASELATSAVQQGVDIVAAVGGDGTINEVAQKVVHSDTALAIIPCGSGNGLARHLQIPMDIRRAVEIINEGVVDSVDYGIINGYNFFCTCGVGFDAFVSLKFANAGKRGLLTYLEKTLQEYLTYKPETYELETEEGIYKYKAFLIACANASQYGNNAYIAPQATLHDGLMDVTVLEPFTVLDIPALSIQLFSKKLDKNSRIKTFRCKRMMIHRSKPGVIHYDGDPQMTDSNVEVEIIRKGLKVIVPSERFLRSQNVLRKAQGYIQEIKSVNEMILDSLHQNIDSIHQKNQEIIKKLIRKE